MLDVQLIQQGSMLGRYQMERALGGGNMGIVWLANDAQYQRQVVIKMLPGALAKNQRYLATFLREARIAASLTHPHILPIYDFGEETVNGGLVVPYLVMPYIDGGTLMDKMRDANGALAWPEALKYLQQAALAIDYAHSQQVIHRDVKPANLLLRQDGWLLLTDFGISKVLFSEETRTHAGSGTPEYMAPEQARGDAVAASDRYSLAIIAYMLLTGYVPFSGKTPYDTLFKHLTELPPSPCELNPALPPQTEAVLLRGLEKTPGKRYPSCKQFVEDLERSYQGRSLLLPPLSQQLRDTSHMQTVRPPFVIPLLGQAPLPLTPSQPGQVQAPATPAQPQPPLSQPAASQPGTARSGPPDPTMLATPPRPAPATPAPAPPPPPPVPAAPPATGPHHKINRRTALIVGGSTLAVAAGATGLVALGSSLFRQGGMFGQRPASPTPPPAGPLHLIPAKPLVNLTGHNSPVRGATWDPSGRYLASYGEENRVLLWDLGSSLQHPQGSIQTNLKPVNSWITTDHSLASGAVRWSPDGRTLAIAVGGQQIYLADALTPNSKPRQAVNNSSMLPFGAFNSPAWSPDSKQLSVCVSTIINVGEVDVWQIDKLTDPAYNLTYTRPTEAASDSTLSLDWSRDGRLAGLTFQYDIIVWNTQKRLVEQALQQPARLTGNTRFGLVTDAPIYWSPADPHLLAAWNVDSISIYDVRQKKPLYQLTTDDPELTSHLDPLHPLLLLSFCWSPNGRYLAGCYGRSKHIYIWDLQAKNPKKTRDGLQIQSMIMPVVHNDTVTDLSWSPNGRFLVSSSLDKTIVVSQVDQ